VLIGKIQNFQTLSKDCLSLQFVFVVTTTGSFLSRAWVFDKF